MKKILQLAFFIAVNATSILLHAQDIQFSKVEDAALLFNPAATMKASNQAILLYRNMQTQGQSAYVSTAGIVTLDYHPIKVDTTQQTSYFSFTIGMTNENALQHVLTTSSALLGVGYHLSLNKKGLLLSLAFQTQFNNSSINFSGQILPNQLDAYGINSAIAPSDIIYNKGAIQWMSVHSGLNLSNTSAHNAWYLGLGMRHVNQPSVAWQENKANFSLPMSLTTQMGYSYFDTHKTLGVYAYSAKRAQATELLFGVYAQKPLNFLNTSIKLGLAYRSGDGLIPSCDLSWSRTKLGLSYDLGNATNASIITKHALEIGLNYKFK